jgi:hypothetical protein
LRTRRGLIVLVVCLGAFASGVILGHENLMQKLPLYERFQCALCHSIQAPVPGLAPLNKFGADFRANGDEWNAALAEKDSDSDGFTNGMELGDDDGDGVPNVSNERSNPGNPLDKPSSVSEETWGVIKKLFSEKTR